MCQIVPIASVVSLGTCNPSQMNDLSIYTENSAFMKVCTDTAISLMKKPVQLQSV